MRQQPYSYRFAPLRKPKFRISNTMICGTAPAPRPPARASLSRRYSTLLDTPRSRPLLCYTRSDNKDRRAATGARRRQSRHKRRTGEKRKGNQQPACQCEIQGRAHLVYILFLPPLLSPRWRDRVVSARTRTCPKRTFDRRDLIGGRRPYQRFR
jgi:hypothetical protein